MLRTALQFFRFELIPLYMKEQKLSREPLTSEDESGILYSYHYRMLLPFQQQLSQPPSKKQQLIKKNKTKHTRLIHDLATHQ